MLHEEDKTIVCPCNPAHLKRMPYRHLVKCRKNTITQFYANCPLDATHHIPKEELLVDVPMYVPDCEKRNVFQTLHIYRYIKNASRAEKASQMTKRRCLLALHQEEKASGSFAREPQLKIGSSGISVYIWKWGDCRVNDICALLPYSRLEITHIFSNAKETVTSYCCL